MSEVQHTPEPWKLTHVGGSNFAVQAFDIRGMFGNSPGVYPIFQKDISAIDGGVVYCSPGNARRIVAAVNACRGIMTESLEMMGEESVRVLIENSDRLRNAALRERDEARAMVKELAEEARSVLESEENCGSFDSTNLWDSIRKAEALS